MALLKFFEEKCLDMFFLEMVKQQSTTFLPRSITLADFGAFGEDNFFKKATRIFAHINENHDIPTVLNF